ncbi:MAG: glucose dehydrogenase, partial [Acidobacteria bacterium]
MIAAADLALEPLITGLNSPVAITTAGDGSGRLFITQQGGQILIYDGTKLLSTPFLDLGPTGKDLIVSGGEQGLLSVAFHPNYSNNGFLYVNYTRKQDGATVVARYQVSAGDPNIADPNSASPVITIAQPYANHNGGQLQFGPDGYLYIGMGDGGSGGDPQNHAQDLESLLGKMLRVDIDHASPYTIPASNPFVGNANALPEIWAYGLRNPWRFSFDRVRGDLWIGDVGQNNWEEVDLQAANSSGGENYGWRLMEGRHCYNPSTGCNNGTLTFPMIEYGHTNGRCAVTGGYRYRGT